MTPIKIESALDKVRIGLIQTDLDHELAWGKGLRSGKVRMHAVEESRAWSQIRLGFRYFRNDQEQPRLILIPELAVPRTKLLDLQNLARASGAIVIAGLDYDSLPHKKKVKNQAAVIVPYRRGSSKYVVSTSMRIVGKTDPSFGEKALLTSVGYEMLADPIVWRFDSKEFGSFGVVICYDLLDLERALLYRGQIQHLFVLAYNRDVTSFNHIAEALARTLYCNVVICNTGYFGGSLSISPFKDPWERTIYRHEGSRLNSVQSFDVPVKALICRQQGIAVPEVEDEVSRMKNLPPGFPKRHSLAVKASSI